MTDPLMSALGQFVDDRVAAYMKTAIAPAPTPTSGSAVVPSFIPAMPSCGGTGWKLEFADDFKTFRRDVWGYGTTRPGNSAQFARGNNPQWETQVYPADGSQVSITPDGLLLRANRQNVTGPDGKPYQYVSGGINTAPHDDNQKAWTAGGAGWSLHVNGGKIAFETRCKLPSAWVTGWAACWLTNLYGWPPEWDLMEAMPGPSDQRRPRMTLHWQDASHSSPVQVPVGDDKYAQDFHTYTSTLSPMLAEFFVDGQKIGQVSDPIALSKMQNATYYLIVNLATTGSATASLDFVTRYVAVWSA